MTNAPDVPTGGHPPLHRPYGGRMLAGVCAGIAEYFDLDVTVVRIIFAVLAVFGGAAIPLYLAGWLLIPGEGDEVSMAEDFVRPLRFH